MICMYKSIYIQVSGSVTLLAFVSFDFFFLITYWRSFPFSFTTLFRGLNDSPCEVTSTSFNFCDNLNRKITLVWNLHIIVFHLRKLSYFFTLLQWSCQLQSECAFEISDFFLLIRVKLYFEVNLQSVQVNGVKCNLMYFFIFLERVWGDIIVISFFTQPFVIKNVISKF